VGGLVTLSNLAADVQVSPKTAASWLEMLERMYLVFAVRPFTRSLPRAVLKPPEVYFFDTVARLKRPYDQGKIQVRDPFAYFSPEVYANSP
jgi:predicted AAA+ superfamily ATPase